jgi:long-subunit acyl-CoA synthetase (AMP-forming)
MYIHTGMHSRFPTVIVVLNPEYPNAKDLKKEQVLQEFNSLAEANNLVGFERVKDVHLAFDEFMAENGMMTPSTKMTGHKIETNYKDILG